MLSPSPALDGQYKTPELGFLPVNHGVLLSGAAFLKQAQQIENNKYKTCYKAPLTGKLFPPVSSFLLCAGRMRKISHHLV